MTIPIAAGDEASLAPVLIWMSPRDSLAILIVLDGQFWPKLPMSMPSKSVAWFSFSEPRREYVWPPCASLEALIIPGVGCEESDQSWRPVIGILRSNSPLRLVACSALC